MNAHIKILHKNTHVTFTLNFDILNSSRGLVLGERGTSSSRHDIKDDDDDDDDFDVPLMK